VCKTRPPLLKCALAFHSDLYAGRCNPTADTAQTSNERHKRGPAVCLLPTRWYKRVTCLFASKQSLHRHPCICTTRFFLFAPLTATLLVLEGAAGRLKGKRAKKQERRDEKKQAFYSPTSSRLLSLFGALPEQALNDRATRELGRKPN